MDELPTERFTVADTSDGFRSWLKGYGKIAVGAAERDGKETFYYEAIPGATVLMEFDTDPDRLEVTATLTFGSDADGRTFDGDLAALAGFHALCEAIRAKYAKGHGPRAGTNERVREMDRLLRSRECTSYRQAQARVKKMFGTGIDLRTYLDECKGATGNDPIRWSEE
jgi:hypothetical protein